jgi:ParB family transcriptional regulator, chromosome partitioning protein
MEQRKALGKGLASLLPSKQSKTSNDSGVVSSGGDFRRGDRNPMVTMLSIGTIVANRQQPRTEFDDGAINELASSIKKSGVIQPIIVTESSVDGRYELIAGERRLRASRIAGLTMVPVVIRQNVDEEALLQLAIVENVQREDLNAIEEAKGYQSLIDQFDYTTKQVAEVVGKAQPAVINTMRLLKLPKAIQDDVISGRMSAGHARALLAIDDKQEQLTLRDQVLQAQLSVRRVEQLVQARRGKATRERPTREEKALSPQLRHVIDEMTKHLGLKVRLQPKNEKSGTLQIEYYSLQDLDRIYRTVTDYKR